MTELIMRVSEENGKTTVTAMREIVRCKDCRHNWDRTINHGIMHPKCYFTDYKLAEDDFCSRGEKI